MILLLAVWLSAIQFKTSTSTCWREEKKALLLTQLRSTPSISFDQNQRNILNNFISCLFRGGGKRHWRSDMKSKQCLGNIELLCAHRQMVCVEDSSASKGKITKPLRAKIITQPLIKAKGSSKGALNSIICNFLKHGTISEATSLKSIR